MIAMMRGDNGWHLIDHLLLLFRGVGVSRFGGSQIDV